MNPGYSALAAPSLEALADLAQAALEQLPEPFRRLIGEVQMRVQDFADDEVLDDLGIEDPFELSGLYQGADLSRRSVLGTAAQPSMLFLYRRPILDEWCEHGDITLGELVTHVLVHEIGHHFGLSDADMEAIEQGRR